MPNKLYQDLVGQEEQNNNKQAAEVTKCVKALRDCFDSYEKITDPNYKRAANCQLYAVVAGYFSYLMDKERKYNDYH